ncbi:hypothetical protein PIB30_093971 [Stylosanthes scabra]|uniref:Uncharacterized protein n=1 Tax=Stylosanthes scabra TaxID=79078 RepID=A0ABU6WV80_9FABA|nr:hypothetical protein [Stylosanthes scabra]
MHSQSSQFDRGCTSYVTVSRQTHRAFSSNPRLTLIPHVKRGKHLTCIAFHRGCTSYVIASMSYVGSVLQTSEFGQIIEKRKGKAVASSSGEPPIFKTPYHEAHYKRFFNARDVLTESIIEYEEESLNPMKVQIITRKWEKLARPIQGVGFNMI